MQSAQLRLKGDKGVHELPGGKTTQVTTDVASRGLICAGIRELGLRMARTCGTATLCFSICVCAFIAQAFAGSSQKCYAGHGEIFRRENDQVSKPWDSRTGTVLLGISMSACSLWVAHIPQEDSDSHPTCSSFRMPWKAYRSGPFRCCFLKRCGRSFSCSASSSV